MEIIKRKPTLPKIPNQMQLLLWAKQNILELTYLSRKFQEYKMRFFPYGFMRLQK